MVGRLIGPVIKKYLKLFLSMMLVSSLGIALMIGLSSSAKTLDSSLSKYISDYKYADLVIMTEPTDFETAKKIENLSDVYKVDSKLVLDASLRVDGTRNIAVRAFSFGIKNFEEFYFWEMNENKDYLNVAADYRFAKENNLHAGDLLEIKLLDEFQTVCIGYLVSSPDCLGAARDQYSWGENKDFGYFFVPYNLTYGTELYGQLNQFNITKESWAESDEAVLDEVVNMLEENGVKVNLSYVYDDSPVSMKVEGNVHPITVISYVIPIVFFICAIIIICLFLSQMIGLQRKEIGILRALGFTNDNIYKMYSIIMMLVSAGACVIGIIGGKVLYWFLNGIFQPYFPLPYMVYDVDYLYFAIAIISTILVGQIAGFISTRKITKILPTEAMTRSVEYSVAIPKWINAITKVLNADIKYGIASIFRNTKRFLFTIICIALSLMMIASGLAFKSSSDYIIDSYYFQRAVYDAEVFLRSEPGEEIINEYKTLDGVEMVEGIAYSTEEFVLGDNIVQNTICGIVPGSVLLNICDYDGNKYEVPKDGIILDKLRAEKLGAKRGDIITINDYELEVIDIVPQSVAKLSYVSMDTLEKICEPSQYTLLIKGGDKETIIQHGFDVEEYKYTSFRDVLLEGNIKTLTLTQSAVYVIIAFGVLMGFLIIYNTTRNNLFEQRKEISVLRSLGYQVSQISKIWLVQTGIQFVLASGIGLALSKLFASKTLLLMGSETRTYLYHVSPNQTLFTLAIVLAYILISHMAAMGDVRKWDLTENIKEKE